jgi:hypothetical protein
MRETAELKGNNSSDAIRFAVLKKIASLDIQIHAIILNKERVYKELTEKKDKLYNWVVGSVSNDSIYGHKEIHLIADRRSGSRFITSDFDKYVKYKVSKNYAITPKLDIEHRPSHSCPELGATDFVVWAIHRKYEEGDETALASLFNKVYHGYAGFVPRTPEYWRWSCLDRPDVEKEGIMVVVNRGRIVAYAVVGKSGNIWESCFDDAHDKKALLSLVLERAIEYLTRVGSDLITLN